MTSKKCCSVKGCFNRYYAKGYCEKHYANMRRHGYPIKHFCTRPIEYEIDSNGCFNCTSHKQNRDGYPTYRIRKKNWLMSRFIYTEMFGEIPKGLVVRHKCDNPKCINPEHLELGTVYDNNQDMVKRNRYAKGGNHPHARLTDEEVKEIKLLLKEGKLMNKEIAEMHGVDFRIISDIKCGRRWKHVQVG